MTPRYAAVISRSAISPAQGGPPVDLPGAAPQPWKGQAMCWQAGCAGVAAPVGGPLVDRLWDRQHEVLRRHWLRVGARTDWRSGGHQRRHRRPRSPPPMAAAQSTRMPPIPGPPPGSPSAAKPGASYSSSSPRPPRGPGAGQRSPRNSRVLGRFARLAAAHDRGSVLCWPSLEVALLGRPSVSRLLGRFPGGRWGRVTKTARRTSTAASAWDASNKRGRSYTVKLS